MDKNKGRGVKRNGKWDRRWWGEQRGTGGRGPVTHVSSSYTLPVRRQEDEDEDEGIER